MPDSTAATPDQPIMLANLTSPQTGEVWSTCDMVLVPIGAHEQHGPALPVSTDALTAQVMCSLVATLLAGKVAVAPTIPWGVSWHHEGRPGTISLRDDTLVNLVIDICRAVSREGAKRIVLVNTHGGNTAALTIAAERARQEFNIPLVTPVFAYTLIANAARDVLGSESIGHGGGDEAAAVMAIRPDLVDRERLTQASVDADLQRIKTIVQAAGGSFPIMMHKLTPTGATGDASGATDEAGHQILGQAVSQLRAVCEVLLEVDLTTL